MAFIKRDVKDRVVQYPRRYQLVEVSQGIYDLVPVTGTVIEEGTAINKAYLQPIEDALGEAATKEELNSHLADIATQAGTNKIPRAKSDGKLDISWFDLTLSPSDIEAQYLGNAAGTANERIAKTATLPPVAGTVRISFTLDPYNSTKAYGRVTIDDVEVMNYNSSSVTSYSKDVEVSGGEQVNFYVKSGDNNMSYIRYMNIGYTFEFNF